MPHPVTDGVIPNALFGRTSLRFWLPATVALLAGSAVAQTPPATDLAEYTLGSGEMPVYVEYDKRVRAPEQLSALGSELFGDEVSLYAGQTGFRHVDTDVPGNNTLPVPVEPSRMWS